MEGVDHVHVVQVRRGRLIGQVHRVLQRQVPDGERLILGVARPDAALVLMVQLAQTGGHLAAAGAGGRYHHDGTRGLDIVVFAQAVVGHDVGHVRGIPGNGIVAIAPDAQGRQPLDEGVRRRLTGVLGDDHGANIKAQAPENIHEPQHVLIVADAQVAPDLLLLDVSGADDHHDLHVVPDGGQHADLAVRLESRQHPGGVVIVEQLAAELDIQLVAELLPPGPDVLGLEGQVFVVVEPDLHMCSLLSGDCFNLIIIHDTGPGGKSFFAFFPPANLPVFSGGFWANRAVAFFRRRGYTKEHTTHAGGCGPCAFRFC